MSTPTVAPAKPQSLAALLRLCREHGDLEVTRKDSLDEGNCQPATDAFIERYLGGRTKVPLRDLIPFLHSGHDYWHSVLITVERALSRFNILDNEYVFSDEYAHRVKPPTRKRQVDLD